MTYRRAAVLLVLLAFAALPAAATTLIPFSDAVLVDRAPLIVEATVVQEVPTTASFPATDWQVTVERVLKGELGSSSLVVRLPGGRGADGMSLRIYGTPPLQPGAQALLMLRDRGDGTWGVTDFPQGGFVGVSTSLHTLALRDFSQVRVLDRSGRVGGYEPYREFDRFARWIEDRAQGHRRRADYIVRPRRSELRTITENFTLFVDSGLNLRWFEFDGGQSVTFKTHVNGVPGLSGGGAAEVIRALAAWTNETTTPVRLVYGGTTTATGGHQTFDRENVILWNDPNDEIAGTYGCIGGTLAIGGPWYDTSFTGSFNGKTWIRIQGGDVIFNDGIECNKGPSPNFSKFIEEVSAHEIGHTLGIGHSSESQREPNSTLKQALMYFQAHDDGRGARLNSDDVAALQTLYRPGGATGGGGGGGGGGQAGCPASTLCLLKGRFQVTVTWQNQFNGSSGSGQPIVNSDLSGFFYFTDPANVELIVKILDFGDAIKVFYSQLTNLQFTMTVTDTTTGQSKTYKNTAGDCGAIDNDFAASASTGSLVSGLQSQTAAASGSCKPNSNTLCLLNNRFAVTVDWRNQFNGTSGVGAAKSLSGLTGAFSFDDPFNLEILIKTLDFGNILVIYGSLSNFEYTIHVLDTTTGVTKDYRNAAGHYCGGLDQNAF